MGQMTMGLLWGCVVPEGMDLHGDDGPGDGLLRKWEKACAKQIKAVKKEDLARYERAETRFVPDTEFTDVSMVGFWIAAGASGKSGCPDLGGSVPVDEIATTEPYKEALDLARRQLARLQPARTERTPASGGGGDICVSVTSVELLWEGRGGRDGIDRKQRYVRVYEVLTDDPLDDEDIADLAA